MENHTLQCSKTQNIKTTNIKIGGLIRVSFRKYNEVNFQKNTLLSKLIHSMFYMMKAICITSQSLLIKSVHKDLTHFNIKSNMSSSYLRNKRSIFTLAKFNSLDSQAIIILSYAKKVS